MLREVLCLLLTASAAFVTLYIALQLLASIALDAAVAIRVTILPRWLWEPKENYFAFLGAAFGSLITLFGIFVSRSKERRAAVQNLIERLEFNQARSQQAQGYFEQSTLPTFDFDTTGIILWLSRSEGILSPETIKKLNWHRYQLDHLNVQMGMLRGQWASQLTVRTLSEHGHTRLLSSQIAVQIHEHLEVVDKGTKPLVAALRAELG